MKTKKTVGDMYDEYIKEEFKCKTSDELLGKKYVIGKQFGVGDYSRMKIEDGLEISKFNMCSANMYFDNKGYKDDILEIGYCYSGTTKILTLPSNKEYMFKEGQIFFYKTLNNVEYFEFKYDKCKTISICMHFNTIKNAVNPIWEDKAIMDWETQMNNIFKEDILIIEKASYDIKKIAEEINKIPIDNMMGYMKLKLKTIEFLTSFFEGNSNGKLIQNQGDEEKESIIRAKKIISKNLQNPPCLKELASDLNMSLYKLQRAFKNITGDTVYEYIKKLRIEKAKYLLKSTDMSILEIANEIGYENPSKFSKAFKSYNNINPLKYRKLNKSV
ncbi:AraC family transcriptional regulator [Clostridium sporogenes]|uniref:AraC family transcriptional regulator n=1 Tax=Clostridium botulinum TaxID=1491 RepID=A0A6M0SXU6_CLOBO|nr:AraC family transcriptional regulator [Clostridium sporogenes]NFA60318.1 AraC family transcriptional regulator [Clostridium botulinum]NFI72874.1 helix-turn-helix transcriptional regulator [Clostridium sporogenes]NFL73150.1 helix-turn-helix transcriptional regulator [Clostridium sporogenes]NFM23352.1 helix-turn-helix transcriptional regulator [Clostridium sporogenes]NFP60287.1 helix-turn-helix transcriptional regulator [Clostridium sporogenes]